MTTHQEALGAATRPIIGIENRTAQEVFDIMADRIRRLTTLAPADNGLVERLRKLKVWDDHPSNASLGPLAADTITAQAAEIERLKALLDEFCNLRSVWTDPHNDELIRRSKEARHGN